KQSTATHWSLCDGVRSNVARLEHMMGAKATKHNTHHGNPKQDNELRTLYQRWQELDKKGKIMATKVMQSSTPPVFRMPLGNGNDEVAIADTKEFTVRITSADGSVDTFAAAYFWNSRQYIFSDVLP